MPQDWTERIHAAETEAELDAVRRSVDRSQPFGSETRQKRTAKLLDLEYTFHKPGRPKKKGK